MKPFNSYETLSGIVPAELTRVVDQLNRTGFVTDEDGLCLGSALIEYWSRRCTQLIQECGYEGGELVVSGKFFSAVGAIYILYDANRHTGKDAAEELQRVAERERLGEISRRHNN
ncbi:MULTISPECIES: hypothetical protein [unclassified Stenotrophomonas]|uniref:hypothetical protein n=1 Tax=unclassified Stenotrophomonas TaxID=196198 RepID=UPI0013110091|nr:MULTISPECIES: hypothetical protein [unclassified Stenotrophomonas]